MARAFNPAQHPRDRFGRFTKSRTVKASAKDRKAAQQVAEGFTPKQVGRNGRAAYLREIADQQPQSAFADVLEANKTLRAGKDSDATAKVDAAMTALPDDVLLSRRVPLSAFGSTDPASLQGMKVRDAGFAPAQLGTVPAADGQVRMHIAVPAGTRAAVNPDSGEVVLDRDTEMVVAKVQSANGGHDMWLTVLPKAGAKLGSEPEQAEPALEPDGDADVRGDLMKLKVPELQARMRERGLKPGKLRKSQMVDALVADETGTEQTEPQSRTSSEPSGEAPPASFDDRVAAATVGDDALRSVPLSLIRTETHAGLRNRNGLSVGSREALADYREASYTPINRALRSGDSPDQRTADQIAGIDAAMGASPLPADVVTWRGLRTGQRLFGDHLGGDLTGFEWREDAYVSSSTERSIADQFAGTRGVRMRMLTPSGVGAIQVSDSEGLENEAEILFERGVSARVVADRGVGPDGVRDLDVEVVPAQPETGRGGAEPVRQEKAPALQGADALAAAPANLVQRGGSEVINTKQRQALNGYKKLSYLAINRALRDGDTSRDDIVHIDEVMAASKLAADVRVFRGMKSGRRTFGDRLDGDLTGLSWRDDAYVSTSASEKVAADFASSGPSSGGLVLRINAPSGTGAVTMSKGAYESELLLDRGHTFVVTRDHGKVGGVRIVDVELTLPAGVG